MHVLMHVLYMCACAHMCVLVHLEQLCSVFGACVMVCMCISAQPNETYALWLEAADRKTAAPHVATRPCAFWKCHTLLLIAKKSLPNQNISTLTWNQSLLL